MNARWIDIAAADGGEFTGYLTLPPTGRGPGLLLLQEICGVNAHIRAVADQYAMDGWVVLAPDVFWRQKPKLALGYQPEEMAEGVALRAQLVVPQVLEDLQASVQCLRALPEQFGPVSCVGYCMGGWLSYLLATTGAVDAAVSYYPGEVDRYIDRADQLHTPIVFHFAENDYMISAAQVAVVKQALQGNPAHTIWTYPGADHGFNCWARAAYHQHSAALAHGRSLAFLAETATGAKATTA